MNGAVELDKKIEHYRGMASRITGQPVLDGIKHLIERCVGFVAIGMGQVVVFGTIKLAAKLGRDGTQSPVSVAVSVPLFEWPNSASPETRVRGRAS